MKLNKAILIQLLVCLCMVLGVSSGAYAAPAGATPQVETVQSLETTLFGLQYSKEPLESRLNRLEETVFGQVQAGLSNEARVAKLKSALSPDKLGPLSPLAKPVASEAKPSSSPASKQAANTYQTRPNQSNSKNVAMPNPLPTSPVANQAPAQATPAPGETDYPTVSQMEQKVFGKTYVQEDITKRLNRLENEVFKLNQTGSLADRVDNLRLVVLGDTGVVSPQSMASSLPGSGYAPPTAQGYSPTAYPQTPAGYAGSYGQNSDPYGAPSSQNYYNYGAPSGQNAYGQPQQVYNNNNYGNGYVPVATGGNGQVSPDLMAAMSEVEKEVLGKTYSSEPVNARLDRLETKVFQSTSPELAPEDRVQRVIAVASAGGAPMSTKEKAKTVFQTLLPIILTVLPLILL